MEFLRPIFGDELYSQFETAINAWNGNEANKDKLVKLANLAGGEYVGKGKYDALAEQLTGKQTELDTANNLLAELKSKTRDDEAIQNQFSEYENTVARLQNLLAETKLKNAIKFKLLSEKAIDSDIDYLTFRLEQKMKDEGKSLEMDENENIKGWDDILSGLKVQFPTHFESASKKNIIENKLPDGNNNDRAVTKEQFNAMNYEQRVALKKENEALYKQLSGKE